MSSIVAIYLLIGFLISLFRTMAVGYTRDVTYNHVFGWFLFYPILLSGYLIRLIRLMFAQTNHFVKTGEKNEFF